MQTDWYHAKCIFDVLSRAKATTRKIEDPTDLINFDSLRKEDQAESRV